MAEIINLDRLKSKLEDIANPQAMQNALEKACFIVENEAKKKCPVGDGQLRQSITHEIDGSDGIVGTNVSYAPYVEYGTGIFSSLGNGRQDKWSYKDEKGKWHTTIGQKPQPYLHPALQESRKKIIDCFKDEIMKGVKGN